MESSPGQERAARRDRAGVRVVADLLLVSLATILTVILAFHYGEQGGPTLLRLPLGFLFVFFLPGYAITAALFPQVEPTRSQSRSASWNPLSNFERIVTSVGMSVTVTPLVAIGLTLFSQPVNLHSLLSSIAVITLIWAGIGALRRFKLPPSERFAVSRTGVRGAITGRLGTRSVRRVFAGLLILSVAGAGFVAVDTETHEEYTEFGLLPGEQASQNESMGVYPTELNRTESRTLTVDIANEEGETVEYTVVVTLAKLGDEPGEISRKTELDRFDLTLAHGERDVYEHEFRPTMTGDRLRLTYLLYRGQAPDQPSRSTAYRSIHLVVTVTEE